MAGSSFFLWKSFGFFVVFYLSPVHFISRCTQALFFFLRLVSVIFVPTIDGCVARLLALFFSRLSSRLVSPSSFFFPACFCRGGLRVFFYLLFIFFYSTYPAGTCRRARLCVYLRPLCIEICICLYVWVSRDSRYRRIESQRLITPRHLHRNVCSWPTSSLHRKYWLTSIMCGFFFFLRLSPYLLAWLSPVAFALCLSPLSSHSCHRFLSVFFSPSFFLCFSLSLSLLSSFFFPPHLPCSSSGGLRSRNGGLHRGSIP